MNHTVDSIKVSIHAQANDMASLERLHDIVEPLPVSLFWPLATGWWILIALIVATGVWITVKWLKTWRVNAYRRQALLELQQIDDMNALPLILKRAALAAYPRESVASLRGAEWITFLNTSTSRALFSKELGEIMLSLGYSRNGLDKSQGKELILAVRKWITFHRPFSKLSKEQGGENQ